MKEAAVATDVRRWIRSTLESASLRRRLRRFAFICMVSVVGCSSFNREWKRAALQPQNSNELTGRWEGLWMSERNGHNGKLRCLITRTNEGAYNARFHAKYKRILSFGYTVPLTVQRSNDIYRFVGQADLGKLAGGLYRYDGSVAGTNFHSTYRSKYDHGYFRLGRAH